MNEYLLGGLAVARLVLLLVARSLRRRPKVRRLRGERELLDAGAPPTRSSSGDELDTISGIHELPASRSVTGDGRRRRAGQETAGSVEAAELAARVEADREAADWEAQLLAQQLAREAHERSLLTADSAYVSSLDSTTLPDTLPGAEVEPSTRPPSVFDEQAVLEALAREAAEWEARLAAQQLADAERQAAEAAEAAAQAQRAAEEQAAQARAEPLAAQQAQQLEAEREAREAAAARALAEQLAQAETAARQAAVVPQAPEAEVAPEAAIAPAGAALAPAEPEPRTPEQCLVMVADDSKVVRVKTSRLLAKHAYRVALAEDGQDALRQIADELPDVLITDVEMPNLDGFALTRQLRNDPRTAHIPIVMITADDVKHRAEALNAGVSVLLSKPYPEDELLSYLQSTLAVLVPAH